MLFRKIGKLLLGQVTPFQIIAAAIIGGAMGFMPGIQAAGMIFLLLLILIILNANLFVAGAVGVLAKLVSLIAMPVSFQMGQLLLDGPAEGLFRTLVNAPVTALLGLEYYVVTGGLALGIVFGVVCGWVLVRALITPSSWSTGSTWCP